MVNNMKIEKTIESAKSRGFNTAIVKTKDIAVDYSFRKYCKDNLCGKYGANYSCPPDCGTPQQVRNILLSKNSALVVQKICDINGYNDTETIQKEREYINTSVLQLAEELGITGTETIPLGYGGCTLCNPCRRTLDQPCAYPDKKIKLPFRLLHRCCKTGTAVQF